MSVGLTRAEQAEADKAFYWQVSYTAVGALLVGGLGTLAMFGIHYGVHKTMQITNDHVVYLVTGGLIGAFAGIAFTDRKVTRISKEEELEESMNPKHAVGRYPRWMALGAVLMPLAMLGLYYRIHRHFDWNTDLGIYLGSGLVLGLVGGYSRAPLGALRHWDKIRRPPVDKLQVEASSAIDLNAD
jgi:hypothetical protein